MCDGLVTCPFCGTLNRDDQEIACHTVMGVANRTYICKGCGTAITVQAGVPVGNFA